METTPSPTNGPEVERNKAAALRFANEVLSQHNLDVLPELVVENFIEQNPPPGQGQGREGLKEFLSAMFAAFPDLQWTPQELVAEGDRVATWSIWTGTHRSEFFGVPATGRQVSVEAWTIDYFRDGMMVESRIIMNIMALMQQLGVIPEPPPSNE
jgi:steroid delta-isomerase-like uncharacterized protein